MLKKKTTNKSLMIIVKGKDIGMMVYQWMKIVGSGQFLCSMSFVVHL